MDTCFARATSTRQRGAAAVEFALVLPLLLALFALTIFFGRVFMSYAVAQKAAHSAAVYLSTLPEAEMTDSGRAAEAMAVAQSMLDTTLADVQTGRHDSVIGKFACDGKRCDSAMRPATVSVTVDVVLLDTYLSNFTRSVLGQGPLTLQAGVQARYVGK